MPSGIFSFSDQSKDCRGFDLVDIVFIVRIRHGLKYYGIKYVESGEIDLFLKH